MNLFIRKFIRKISFKFHKVILQPNKYLSTQKVAKYSESRSYGLLILPLTAVALGTWQVQRRKWKLNLIDDLEKRTSSIPIALNMEIIDELANSNNKEYTRFKVRGEFDHSREVYIEPRSLLEVGDKNSGLMSAGSSKNIGAHVITPLKLEDESASILVNRGWVPRCKVNPKTRSQGQIEGIVEFNGILRKTEKENFGMKRDKSTNKWITRNINEISSYLQTKPIFIDADFKSSIEGGPIGGQTRISLRNEHFSYIITWYSLAIITFFMWYRRYILRIK